MMKLKLKLFKTLKLIQKIRPIKILWKHKKKKKKKIKENFGLHQNQLV